MFSNKCGVAALGFLLVGVCDSGSVAAPPCTVLAGWYRADEPFPQFDRYWHEGYLFPDEGAMPAAGASAALGGSLHVVVHNTGAQVLELADVVLEGISLRRAIAYSDQRIKRKFASIDFAGLPAADKVRLVAAGEPIWWKADPHAIQPGEVTEIVVRLRHRPRSQTVTLALPTGGKPLAVPVRILEETPSVEDVSVDSRLMRICCYARAAGSRRDPPIAILLDGVDVTRKARIAHDAAIDRCPVTLALDRALAPASVHLLEAKYRDGSTSAAAFRAVAHELAYGMFGGRPGKAGDLSVGRAYVRDLVSHNINIQMPQIGSPAVQAYIKSDEGRNDCRQSGLRFITSDPGKYGVRDPAALYVHDEPDAGDYKAEGVPANRKIGCLAQWCVQHSQELRDAAPQIPQMLNIDGTFKPDNWYVYGQLPDILATDPYYQSRLTSSYWEHPERLPLYVKAGYIYAVTRIAHAACAPKPLHVILNAVAHVDKENDHRFRSATPQEKRIEVYYALAAGAKGLSYWWYTPGGKSSGVGAAGSDADSARLWREIGLLGAEVRTAGPLILKSGSASLAAKSTAASLWTRYLLVADEAVVVIAVNEQYANDRLGTVYKPIEQASVTLAPPSWLAATDVFEISARGVADVPWRTVSNKLTIDLGKVELTRLVIIAQDASLRAELQDLYASQFAERASRLLSQSLDR